MFFQDKFLLYKFRKTTLIDASFYFATFLYFSLLSPYMSSLGFSETLKGIFFAIFGLVGIFIAPMIGSLSDKIGRFKIIIFGIVLEVITLSGYILVQDVATLFVFRIIGSFGFNAVTLSALARVQDTIEDDSKRSRISGLFHSMNAVAIMIAPPLGALIADELGYGEVFTLALVINLVLLIGLFIYDLFFYDDNHPHRAHGHLVFRDMNPFEQIKDFLANKQLRNTAILGMLANFTSPFVSLVLPFLLIQQQGLTNFHLGIMIFVFGIVHSLQYFFGMISDKITERRAIIIGAIGFALSFFFFFLTSNYFIQLGIMAFRSAATSLWNVAMWSFMSRIAQKQNIEGKVVGGYISLSRMSSTLSFLISGALLVAWGNYVLLLYCGIIVFGLFITYKRLGKTATTL